MKCQINNQLKPELPQHKLDRLGKTARCLQLCSFTFLKAALLQSKGRDDLGIFQYTNLL